MVPLDTDMSFTSVADGWIQTYTGKKYSFNDPVPEDIDPRDIAHSLSMICRYNGHVSRFYSVAEHCCIMAEYALRDFMGVKVALAALLHDAAEAYLGDVTTPLKRFMSYEYGAMELKANEAISQRFGVDLSENSKTYYMVKELDRRILKNEVEELCIIKPDWMPSDLLPLAPSMVTIEGWDPLLAEIKYTSLLENLLEQNEKNVNAWK